MSAVSTRLWRRRLGHSALGLGFILLLLLLWDLGVRGQWVLVFDIKMAFLPPPDQVARLLWDFAFGGLYDDAYSATLWQHLGASALRVAAGFGLAAALAIEYARSNGRVSVSSPIITNCPFSKRKPASRVVVKLK